jgi:RNA polymerase-associated protein CTR9
LAFERTLQLDAKCVGALVGLAIMEMNSHTQAGIRHGVQLLGQAYQLLEGKHDSMVLNLLANHFFFTKVCSGLVACTCAWQDYAKVHQLATYAFHGTTNEAMRAESTFQMARAYHAVGDMEQAFQYYFQVRVVLN